MIVKLDNVMCSVHYETCTKLYYVDFDGQVTAGLSKSELIENLKKKYNSVAIASDK
jgi:uncharacterized protein YuzB (UPF0349 family)